MRNRLIILTILGVASIGFLAAFQPFSSTEVQSETAVFQTIANLPVAQANNGTVSAEGQVIPLFYADLAFQLGGTVKEILVEEGVTVSVGDPLIRLEASDFEINLQQAEARLASAQSNVTAAQNQLALAEAGVVSAQGNILAAEANLAVTLAGPTDAQRAEAESRIAAAQATVNQALGGQSAVLNGVSNAQIQAAQANLASVTADLRALENQYQNILDACFETPDGNEVCPLYGSVEEGARAQLEIVQANQQAAQAALDALVAGPTSGQRQLAASGVVLAQGNLALAEAQLALLLAGPTIEQVKLAEVGVEQAQVGVSIAEAGVQRAQAAITQAEAGVVLAETAVASAQALLDRMTLFATFDGDVSRINTSVGELVGGGVPVVTMADFSEWHVQTIDLAELDIAAVSVGDAVDITFDAIPEESVSGEVASIALVSSLSRGDVVYEVKIRMADVDALPVRWGMTVFADIDVGR